MGRRKRYLESLGDLPAWGAAAEAKLRLAHRLRFCCMKRILFDTGPITGTFIAFGGCCYHRHGCLAH
jgi:hypothetical protein